MPKTDFLKIAAEEAFIGIKKGEGGPFGAVIVKKGRIIARAHNEVIKQKDPTAHAEIVAIRKAAKNLSSFNLSGCEIYSSCEPCPMCISAIHWAKIGKLFYGATRKDAEKAGFDDKFIYDVLSGKVKDRKLSSKRISCSACKDALEEWSSSRHKTKY
jgi:guanine deaminase